MLATEFNAKLDDMQTVHHIGPTLVAFIVSSSLILLIGQQTLASGFPTTLLSTFFLFVSHSRTVSTKKKKNGQLARAKMLGFVESCVPKDEPKRSLKNTFADVSYPYETKYSDTWR